MLKQNSKFKVVYSQNVTILKPLPGIVTGITYEINTSTKLKYVHHVWRLRDFSHFFTDKSAAIVSVGNV